jgi:hypothetical protein
MKALYDIQFTASICGTKLRVQCVSEPLPVFYVHEHVTQMVSKNAQNASHKDSIGFLELFLILVRHSSFRFVFTDLEHFHCGQPKLSLVLPPLKVHTGKLIWPHVSVKPAIDNLENCLQLGFWIVG